MASLSQLKVKKEVIPIYKPINNSVKKESTTKSYSMSYAKDIIIALINNNQLTKENVDSELKKTYDFIESSY